MFDNGNPGDWRTVLFGNNMIAGTIWSLVLIVAFCVVFGSLFAWLRP